MEYRQLGRSGLKVSALSLGTMTFGGKGNFAKTGDTDLEGAKRQIGMALDAGINLIDTADIYSTGASEEIVGQALKGKRDSVLVATKARFRMGEEINDAGLSRYHLIRAAEASLKRLGTDHIDLYQLHQWDGLTPLDETLEALDTLVRSGKVRYVGVSNFSGWHLMKAMGVAALEKFIAPVSQQIHYSLEAREAEYELIPATLDQGLGVLVWSPLAGDSCPVNTAATRQRRKVRASLPIGASRRSGIRSGFTTSLKFWSALPKRAIFLRRKLRFPGCSGARA